MIFKVMFIFNIEHPYDELDKAERKLSRYADNLENLVEKRTEEVAEANKALVKDIEYAKTIQSAIMPVKHEKFEALEVYSEYVPFEKVGGDYYGLEELNEDYVSFYLGDVAGHGIPAAMMTVFMRQTIVTHRRYQNEIKEIYSPKDVITNLYNKYSETEFPFEMYTVMIYGLFNKKSRKISFSSAGLNTYPLLYEKGEDIRIIEHKGFPICKYDKNYKPDYKNYEIQLKQGNKLIFYTDGTIDVRNKEGEFFGEENLIKLFKKYGHKPPKEISKIIYNEIEEFSKDIKLSDDVNYMIFEAK